MRVFLTLMRRELSSYFVSLTGYVIIAAATFLNGFSFVLMLMQLREEPSPMPVTEMFYITPFFWIVLLLAAPVITMRTFAHERATGTYETLMTSPVRDGTVVLAKYVAALFFFLIMWLPVVACVAVIQHYSNERHGLDAGIIGSTYLGILLIGALFLSFGVFASALTRSQTVAAMVSFVLCTSMFLLSFLPNLLPDTATWAAQLLSSVALFDQMHDFARGVLDTRSIVFFVSFTLFFLFLTLRVVESRRWK
jgi:ABC-2 type transport system permease protein